MECDVCLIEWDTITHIPRILSCGHTICEACLISMFRNASSKGSGMFCPSCMKLQKKIKEESDIKKLIKNINLLRITEKIDQRRSAMGQSFLSKDNLNMSIFSKNLNSSRFVNDNLNKTNLFNANEMICKSHGLQVHSFGIESKGYLCDLCIKETNVKFSPMPNFIKETKRKIDSSEVKLCLLKQEIQRLQEFFASYLEEFESTNLTKIDELFQYMNKLIVYNYNTAKTVLQQCKKEQEIQIEAKMNELKLLFEDIRESEIKLKSIQEKEKEDHILIRCNEELNQIFNKLNNFVNYEIELNLFQMNIGIKEEIKESMFNFLQNAYYVDVDYVTINGETPLVKHILQKDKFWSCVCGEGDNSVLENYKCTNCGIYRKIESYENILPNPAQCTKNEINQLNDRRKLEINDFQVLYKKEKTKSNASLNKLANNKYYILDLEWFLLWKCFVTNDMSDKYISNSKKRISPNKQLGVLPPGPISNINLFEKGTLRQGLKKNNDYLIIDEKLWNFFYSNYNTTLEISLESNSQDIYGPIICKENRYPYMDMKNINENNLITPSPKNYLIQDNNNYEKELKPDDQIENEKDADVKEEENSLLVPRNLQTPFPDLELKNEKIGASFCHSVNESNIINVTNLKDYEIQFEELENKSLKNEMNDPIIIKNYQENIQLEKLDTPKSRTAVKESSSKRFISHESDEENTGQLDRTCEFNNTSNYIILFNKLFSYE